MPKRKQKGLVLLAYSDSEHEEDPDDDEQHDYGNDDDNDLKSNDESDDQLKDNDGDNDDGNVEQQQQQSNKCEKIYFEDIYGDRNLSILEFHQSLLGKVDVNDIQIPPATRISCTNELQNQIENLYEKVQNNDYDLIHAIQKRKSMRNPSIYEKMISYCEINEMATNYPKDIYDPEPFLQMESFYEELSRQQKELMEKREKDKQKQKTSSSTTTTTSTTIGETNNKKSKWDSNAVPSSSTSAAVAAALAAANKVKHLTNSSNNNNNSHHHHHHHHHSSNKPTVISAFGTISKKK
ncbi:SAP30-binding protein [Dermatophagoides pteronyssinus]|uniref:SAP30-binding protein n=1 Tax=Dermatophagoides pteronyssinus TaxID=6956 RepID=A0ABQ8JNE5_DERPT|nr:SAP30-binding protein [Dermatophagoides pteronyssinus]